MQHVAKLLLFSQLLCMHESKELIASELVRDRRQNNGGLLAPLTLLPNMFATPVAGSSNFDGRATNLGFPGPNYQRLPTYQASSSSNYPFDDNYGSFPSYNNPNNFLSNQNPVGAVVPNQLPNGYKDTGSYVQGAGYPGSDVSYLPAFQQPRGLPTQGLPQGVGGSQIRAPLPNQIPLRQQLGFQPQQSIMPQVGVSTGYGVDLHGNLFNPIVNNPQPLGTGATSPGGTPGTSLDALNPGPKPAVANEQPASQPQPSQRPPSQNIFMSVLNRNPTTSA